MDGKMEARQHGARRAAALYRTRAAEGGCGGRMLASTDCTGRAEHCSRVNGLARTQWSPGGAGWRGIGVVEEWSQRRTANGAVAPWTWTHVPK